MIKDFDTWNKLKKSIDSLGTGKRFFREREMWWCSLGLNMGFEQDGKGKLYQRPVLIIKVFSQHTCVVLPITSSPSEHRYRIKIGRVEGLEASVVLSQIKTIDSRRLTQRIGYLNGQLFSQIGKSVKVTL